MIFYEVSLMNMLSVLLSTRFAKVYFILQAIKQGFIALIMTFISVFIYAPVPLYLLTISQFDINIDLTFCSGHNIILSILISCMRIITAFQY